jgi:fumarylpyruvate hydrolase
MKIIVVSPAEGDNKTGTDTLLNKAFSVKLKADSALLKGGKPFFIPEWGDPCMARPYVVARLSRLGKSIPRRFACRYFDGLSLGVSIDAVGLQQTLQAQGLASDLAGSIDGGAMLGEVSDYADGKLHAGGTELTDAHFSLEVDGREIGAVQLGELETVFAAQIEWLSQWMTLRQGDLLFGVPLCDAFPLQIGRHVGGYLDGKAVLDFNVK